MGFLLSSEPLIFLYTIIFTINYTVLPQLVLKKVCLMTYNATACHDTNNLDDQVQKSSSTWWFYMLALSLVPSVFTVLIWGPLTDIIGRRRAILLIPFVNGLRALVYLLNAYFVEAHVAYLLFGSVLSCLYGEFQGVIALCYAYIADITEGALDQRTMRMAFIEASVFFAGVPAGLLAGYLLQQIGFVSVFALTLGINVLTLLYVVCFLPERAAPRDEEKVFISCDPGNQEQTEETEREGDVKTTKKISELLNPFVHFKQVLTVVTSQECRRIVLPLLCAFGLSVCAVMGELIVQTLYLRNRPLNFTPQLVGYYSTAQSTVRGIGVILITQLSFHLLDLNDYTLVFVGLSSQLACYTLIGFARSPIAVFAANVAGCAVPVATSVLRSVVTKQVSKQNYGAALSSIEAVDAVATVLTNSMSLWTYNLTITFYSGAVFFALAAFALLALIFVLLAWTRSRTNIVPIE